MCYGSVLTCMGVCLCTGRLYLYDKCTFIYIYESCILAFTINLSVSVGARTGVR